MKNRYIKFTLVLIVVCVAGSFFLSKLNARQDAGVYIDGKYFEPKSVTRYDQTQTLNQPAQVASEFYNYYLSNIYGKMDSETIPETVLVGNKYQLVTKDYQNFIKNSGFFSSTFTTNEEPSFSACNDALEAVDPRRVSASGGSPQSFVTGNACGFLSSYRWVGGQGEELNTAKVLDSEMNGPAATVKLVVGQKLNDTYSYNFSYPKVTLIRENGSWKISSIELDQN